MIYSSVVQPIRHSPHVANGSVNVSNGFDSEYFKNRTFLTKLDISSLILSKNYSKVLNTDGPGHKSSIRFVVLLWHSTLLIMFLSMWRMDSFIRHKCGKCKNTVGHRWFIVFFEPVRRGWWIM